MCCGYQSCNQDDGDLVGQVQSGQTIPRAWIVFTQLISEIIQAFGAYTRTSRFISHVDTKVVRNTHIELDEFEESRDSKTSREFNCSSRTGSVFYFKA
ncbi:unnamed protein product [Allacma fusca]|uniref:Uncharacterized protein n=1 Tax=Allacma fusca TaxID=39272 RepID=A0A8J2P4G2_9HEXA|nr:unnamed protein product [Allacma fusca]